MDSEAAPVATYAESDKQNLRLAFKALIETCGRALQTNSEVRALTTLSSNCENGHS